MAPIFCSAISDRTLRITRITYRSQILSITQYYTDTNTFDCNASWGVVAFIIFDSHKHSCFCDLWLEIEKCVSSVETSIRRIVLFCCSLKWIQSTWCILISIFSYVFRLQDSNIHEFKIFLCISPIFHLRSILISSHSVKGIDAVPICAICTILIDILNLCKSNI